MTRTERYNRGLAMVNRIFELQESHSWSNQETTTALACLDEALPINLHDVGAYHITPPILTYTLIYAQHSNLYFTRKPPQVSSQNMAP